MVKRAIQKILSLVLIIVVLMFATEVFAVFGGKINSAGAPEIISVDSRRVINNEVSGISDMPEVKGTASPGSAVSIFLKNTLAAPQNIAKVPTESDLAITYQPAQPSPGFFSDDFNQGLNGTVWGTEVLNNGNVLGNVGTLETTVTGIDSRAIISTRSDRLLDLFNAPKPLFAEIELTKLEVTGSGYNTAFDLDNNCVGSVCKSIRLSVGDYGIGYDINDGVIPGGIHGNITPNVPAVGQKIKIRTEINNISQVRFMADLNFDGVFESISPWETFTLWNELSRINFGIFNNQNTGRVVVAWDNLATNFPLPPIPASYLMGKTGMQLGNISYMDPVPFVPSLPPGVLAWDISGGGITVIPPSGVNVTTAVGNDIYVYLATINFPPGFAGPNPITLRWTIYSLNPAYFSQIVAAINSQGIPIVVDAFAKAFAFGTSNSGFSAESLPLKSTGSIDQGGNILFPSSAYAQIAKTKTSKRGQWDALFGKDDNGSQLPGFDSKTLNDFGVSPYVFYAENEAGQSASVSAVLKPILPQSPAPPVYTAPQNSNNNEKNIDGAKGGNLCLPDICVNIPAGALDGTAKIRVEKKNRGNFQLYTGILIKDYSLTVNGSELYLFKLPVEITWKYSDKELSDPKKYPLSLFYQNYIGGEKKNNALIVKTQKW